VFNWYLKILNMKKIALPVTAEKLIDGHFGHCEYYAVYTISDDNTISDIRSFRSEEGCGCKSNVASLLAEMGVTVMLAGGIGAGAIQVLNNQGITVVRGCSGDATEAVMQFISGNLADSGESCSEHERHHGSGHGHHG